MDQTPKTASAPLPRSPLRVYLVEDYALVRDLIIENLAEIEGVEVAGVADAEDQALSWLNRNACDVLILDLELRQGNGLGVLKALAGRESSSSTVKIVYSNHVSADIRRLAEQFGAAYFFDKTLDTPKLRQLLERLSAP